MKKKTVLIAALLAATTMGLAACGSKTNKSSDDSSTSIVSPTDTAAPVITVENVPTSCSVGATVTLPAATAMDDVDGDLSSKVKVTVSQMKADGVTVNRDIIFEKAANVEQTFTASSNTLLVYKIVYTCKDAAGNKAEKVFTLTAVADNQTGTLELNSDSIPNFNIETGIAGVAGQDIVLPSATAIDEPGSVDISDMITARLYEKKGETLSEIVFASWTDFSETKTVRIPAGEYILVYGVQDVAGNTFETKISVPVSVAQPEEKNLAYDKDNFAFDNDEGYEETGKEGMSWINQFGELAFGNTSAEANLDQTVGFTSKVTKIHEQYVGIAFNADAPTPNGQLFYTISARGSKNRDTMPNKETCTWPDYLFIRIGSGRIESRIERQSDKEMTTIKAYEKGLLDGQDHVLYVQWKNVGESSTAEGAAIRLYGWVDKIPGGEENADFIFEAKVGEQIAQGTLTQEIFTELWNESTGAGWFTMDTYSNNKPHDDDHMRIKGFVVYDAAETQFNADITPPVVSVDFTPASIYAVSEAIAIPEATVEGANDVKVYIVAPDGTKTEITDGTYTPDAAGQYTLVYAAYDAVNNYGYKAFNLNVAVRDAEAPTLTISSEETITVNVGEEVTLPSATAMDNLDGDISTAVKVEIIGTEHITDRVAGGKYYPMTAGTQTVIYTVSDAFGNTTTKQMTVVVNSTASGNLLGAGKELLTSGSGVGLADKEYIYDQKVSTIINIAEQKSIIQINARGPVKNNDWPNGLVIRIRETGDIQVSAAWHDHCIYGSTSYSKQKYWLNQDILFEYQTKNVVIDGTEYIRLQIWVQGEELVFAADAANGGMIGLEDGINALYRKVSDFVGEQVDNIYSSPFWVAAYQSTMTVKEVRIDGTSCEKPADPVVPEGYEINFGSGNSFISESVTVPGGGDAHKVIGKHSNEDYIAVTFNGEEATKGAFCLNVTGKADGWSGGLVFRITQDGFELQVGGPNATKLAGLSAHPFANGVNATSYTLVYKLGYIMDKGIASAVTLDVWFGEANGELTKLVPTVANENCSYDEAKDVFTISSKAFTSSENMTPLDIVVVSLGALNGDCDWTVSKIEKLAVAPGADVEGYTNPVNSNAAEVKITSAQTYVGTADSIVKAVENINENYVAITMKHTQDSSYYAMGINLLGKTENGWTAGLVLAMTKDGHYFRVGGINTSNLVQLNFYSMGNGAEVTVAYQMKYIQTKGKVTKVQITLWQGPAGGELVKVAPHGGVTQGDGWYYDAEFGAFFFDYNIVTEDQFAPDCTLIAMGAFNDKHVDCDWTVTKVEVAKEAPKPMATVINGLDKNTTVSANTDASAQAIANLNDEYVVIDFTKTSTEAFAIGVHILGEVENCWVGDIMIRLASDGVYINHANVAGDHVAQIALYDLSNVTRFVYRITDVFVEGAAYKKVEMWAGTPDNLTKLSNHAISSGMEAFCFYDADAQAYFMNVAAVQSVGYKTNNDCSFQLPAALNSNCEWTVKVSVSKDLPTA